MSQLHAPSSHPPAKAGASGCSSAAGSPRMGPIPTTSRASACTCPLHGVADRAPPTIPSAPTQGVGTDPNHAPHVPGAIVLIRTVAGLPSPATRKAASSRGSSRRGGNRPLIAYEPAVEPVSRASAGCSQLRYISETTEASALSLRPAVGERRLREAWAANGPPPTTRSAVTTASRDETRRAVGARAGAGSTTSTSTRSPTTPRLRWRIVGGLRRRREARRDRPVAE